MFRFNRDKIMPHFLKQGMTVSELAHKAGVAYQSAQRALDGEKVGANIIGKIADALGIGNVMEFLEGEKKMFNKKKVTIARDDGTKKDVEISVDDTGKMLAVWGDEEEIQKAFAQYFSQKQKAAD